MTENTKESGSISREQRSSISMSKLGRTLQSAAAKTSWNDMVKMLFWADPHEGRPEEIRRMMALENHAAISKNPIPSYDGDQLQYVLMLMLVISVAEKRTQEMYAKDFAERCDAISKKHQLKDDQYWKDGNVPAEWTDLDQEFERRSLTILLETLREYDLSDIANQVEVNGPDQLFAIIHSVKTHFLKVLERSIPTTEKSEPSKPGSFPETLQPASRLKKS